MMVRIGVTVSDRFCLKSQGRFLATYTTSLDGVHNNRNISLFDYLFGLSGNRQ
jgi:hypothetical protein